MATIDIPLMLTSNQPFSDAQIKILFSYPNIPDGSDPQKSLDPAQTLDETIRHWLGQTLERDGYADPGKGKDDVSTWVDGATQTRTVSIGGKAVADQKAQLYKVRIPGMLQHGWGAYNRIQDAVRKDGRWDPSHTNEWRFFLTLGVGIVNFRSLQFFHYPPLRLLNPLRDSMSDPVTARCRDMLEVNLESLQTQMTKEKLPFNPSDYSSDKTRMYETRINSSPIAAPDNQGTPQPPYLNDVKPDPISESYIPIEYFDDFQRQMIQLYLSEHPDYPGYTIPVIVYGRNPRMQLAGQWMGPDCAAVLQMLPAAKDSIGVDGEHYLKTPVLGSNHPYLFYVNAQKSTEKGLEVGSGQLVPDNIEKCVGLMQEDLAVTYWQVHMALNPKQDPWQVIKEGRNFWKEPAQLQTVCALVLRQSSLTYAPGDPLGNHFSFKLDLQTAKEVLWGESPMSPRDYLKKFAASDQTSYWRE